METEPITSKALGYVEQKAWRYKPSGMDQLAVEECPCCGNSNSKFYMNVSGGASDGLWDCKVCGEKGSLYQLRVKLGDRGEDVMSLVDTARASKSPAALPDLVLTQNNLLYKDEFADVLDYLVAERGFKLEVIEKMKLGAEINFDKKWVVIPHLNKQGNATYVKFRSVPPANKEFRSSAGREASLYNEAVIEAGMEELIFVEGEADCLACLSAGITGVVGVPGANIQKASWITKVDNAAPKKIYILYDRDKVGQEAAHEMAKRLGLDKTHNILLPEFTTRDGKPGKDINEWFRSGRTLEDFRVLQSQSKPFDVAGVQSTAEVIQEIQSDLETRGSRRYELGTPWQVLTDRLGGANFGEVIGIIAEGKVGKEQPLSAKVLTVHGWSTMGQMKVGTRLASLDGYESKVTGVFPKGQKKTYRVTFSDGRSTLCGAEHLWQVGSVTNFTRDGWSVRSVEELLASKNVEDFFIPLYSGIHGGPANLLVDPWLMGALLGDGGFRTGVIFTKEDPLTRQAVKIEVDRAGCVCKDIDPLSFRIVGHDGEENHILTALERYGLRHKLSKTKWIPMPYKIASRDIRLEVLRGLMDTDGSVEGNSNTPMFNTSSKELAEDVVYLVRSLGGIANISSRIPTYLYKGKKCKGVRAYRVNVMLQEPVFRYSHKAAKECKRKRESRLTIASIKEEGTEECQCIAVSHRSGLYITDDFTVTHNTTMVLNWLDYYAEQGYPSMLYCLEMTQKALVRKWICYKTMTDDADLNKETVTNALDMATRMPADLLFAFSRVNSPKECFELIRQAVRRYGVKVVAFDNLQFLVRSLDHSAQETANLSKQFHELATELGILILLVVQPNRVREGEIVAARNANGSSAIEKDVDAMIALHRNRVAKVKADDFRGFLEANENFEPQLLVRVDLSRYAPGGVCTLWMDGGKSTVREFSQDDKADIKTPRTNLAIPEENVTVEI